MPSQPETTPTPRDFAVWDKYNGLVTVGSVVTTHWSSEDGEHFLARGRVVAITDYEGDVDDEGRTVAIYPRVGVRWPDGDEVNWYATATLASTSSYDEDPPDVEATDLVVLDTRCEDCGVSAENFGRLPVCEACRRKGSCPNCGGYPAETGCYHICPNSVHYYSPEQERADEPWYGADDDRERYAATNVPEQYYED